MASRDWQLDEGKRIASSVGQQARTQRGSKLGRMPIEYSSRVRVIEPFESQLD